MAPADCSEQTQTEEAAVRRRGTISGLKWAAGRSGLSALPDVQESAAHPRAAVCFCSCAQTSLRTAGHCIDPLTSESPRPSTAAAAARSLTHLTRRPQPHSAVIMSASPPSRPPTAQERQVQEELAKRRQLVEREIRKVSEGADCRCCCCRCPPVMRRGGGAAHIAGPIFETTAGTHAPSDCSVLIHALTCCSCCHC